MMRVVHVTPTYLGSDSLVGGGERYATELAKTMAHSTPTRLVSFGDHTRREQWDNLEVHIYKPLCHIGGWRWNPISLAFLSSLRDADVIHCHQFMIFATDLAILLGWGMGKKVFVTDLAGSAPFSLSYHHLPLWKGVRSFLFISQFSRRSSRNFPVDAQVIYGGVDANRFCPGQQPRQPRLLHVGRILSYKGIHDILDALPEGVGLDIVGPAYDENYLRTLKERSQGKDVVFLTDLGDGPLIEKYQRSWVTVLPATSDSGFTTAMESMACGTPVIATAVGSLPEVIEDGVTGFLIPPHSPAAIREKIEYLRTHPTVAIEMGRRARNVILKRFTWDAVAQRCLKIYKDSFS